MEHATRHALQSVLLISGRVAPELRRLLEDAADEIGDGPDLRAASARLGRNRPDLVLIRDDVSVARTLRHIYDSRQRFPASAVVVLADEASVDRAVRYVRAGAYDYVGGALDADGLERLTAGLSAERGAGRDEHERFFCDECPPGVPFAGRSRGCVKALEMIRLVAQSRCNPVLILGETGTGKELAARGVHAWRCGDPERFVAVNCAALTANLLESELFGHTKGAFTGADREKTGLLEAAGTGSIFLDEISEMPPELQAKLLRVLQERTFRKVGGTRDISCEATIIASSNRDLLSETKTGRFRKDLYYRLAVFPITLPSLRDPARRADIALLADYFLSTSELSGAENVGEIDPSAERKLLAHDWPGNVRELRNVVNRAVLLQGRGAIEPQSILLEGGPPEESDDLSPAGAALQRADANKDFSLETAEREFIIRALKETGWQRTRAAALLGITRATLHAKLKRYDIKAPA